MADDTTAELAVAVRLLAIAVAVGFVGVALTLWTGGPPARLGLLLVVVGALLAGAGYLEADHDPVPHPGESDLDPDDPAGEGKR